MAAIPPAEGDGQQCRSERGRIRIERPRAERTAAEPSSRGRRIRVGRERIAAGAVAAMEERVAPPPSEAAISIKLLLSRSTITAALGFDDSKHFVDNGIPRRLHHLICFLDGKAAQKWSWLHVAERTARQLFYNTF